MGDDRSPPVSSGTFRVTSRCIFRSNWVKRTKGLERMNHQDSGTMIVTFLLLLPWLGRAAVSAVHVPAGRDADDSGAGWHAAGGGEA